MAMYSKFAVRMNILIGAALFGMISCSRERPVEQTIKALNHQALELNVGDSYRFVAFGDARFHDPADTQAANPTVRHLLVDAIDKEKPAFVSIGGDIVYSGENAKDWEIWDSETWAWKQNKIPVYPALGNHDLHGNETIALNNYFARFPDLSRSRFYSVKLGNSLLLVLDSSLNEIGGEQGDWLRGKLDKMSSTTEFLFLVFHHPPYTSSSDEKQLRGGHTARGTEKALAQLLEERQEKMRTRIIVFTGHVHNYERHEHNGVTYFVTGGGGAHAYPIPRAKEDPYQNEGINYHYLLVEIHGGQARITMNKLDLQNGNAVWTKPDQVTITCQTGVSTALH